MTRRVESRRVLPSLCRPPIITASGEVRRLLVAPYPVSEYDAVSIVLEHTALARQTVAALQRKLWQGNLGEGGVYVVRRVAGVCEEGNPRTGEIMRRE